jgi:hypothetical protein
MKSIPAAKMLAWLCVLGLAATGCTSIKRNVLTNEVLPFHENHKELIQSQVETTHPGAPGWVKQLIVLKDVRWQELEADQQKWLAHLASSTDLQNIVGLLKGEQEFVKTNVLAGPDGTTYTVRIHYSPLNATNSELEKILAVTKVFDLGQNILHLDNLANPLQFTPTWQSGLRDFLKMSDQLRGFNSASYQNNLSGHVYDLLSDQLQTVAIQHTTNLDIYISLDGILAAYTKAYLDGSYVDRWGVPVSQPDLSKIGSDTIGPFSKVIMEGIYDYALMTPIVHDPSSKSTNQTPTFAVLFPQLYENISTNPDNPGVTSAELEAIHYASKMSAQGAKHLSDVIVKTVGGGSFGIKLSTGDNTALTEVISTLCEEFSRRAAEELTYRFFEKFEYLPDTNPADLFSYVPDYGANDTNIFTIVHPLQQGIVALLVSQDNLRNLLGGGGWKLKGDNITNYENLVSGLADTNNPIGARLSNLSTNLYSLATSLADKKGNLTGDQKQSLVDALNNLIGGKNIYDPSIVAGLNLTPATIKRAEANPQGVNQAQVNRQLLEQAFPVAFSPASSR